MDTNLEKQLLDKYPKILRDMGGDPRVTCMAFGIECDNGWYSILDKCMEKLQYFCDICAKVNSPVQVVADQIKEKFGTLQFYFSVEGEVEDYQLQYSIIENIIDNAQLESRYTCEITGDSGALCKKGRWLKTLCRQNAKHLGYVAADPELQKYWDSKDKT